MTQNRSSSSFSLSGVIGIIDDSSRQIEQAVESGLSSVEIRADLLRSTGLSDQELLALVGTAKSAGLACLYTLRHADQGGTFDGDEQLRVSLCSQALDAGADIIDLEHGTVASTQLLREAAPMILSYHNFNGMLNHTELEKLTVAMEQQSPAAVKIIPTGQNIADAATMMEWVDAASEQIKRIGFTMGAAGSVSRILALSVGSPVTYASFGEPVAPGQVDLNRLLKQYNCMQMGRTTSVIAVTGAQNSIDEYISEHSKKLFDNDSVCIGFPSSSAVLVEQYRQALNIKEIVSL